MRRLILRNPEVRDRAIEAIAALDLGLKKPWSIEIKPYSEPRNLEQNALLWTLVTKLGQHLGYSKDEMMDVVKWKFLPVKEAELPDGSSYPILAHTSAMTKQEMTQLIEQILQWGASLGCDFDE